MTDSPVPPTPPSPPPPATPPPPPPGPVGGGAGGGKVSENRSLMLVLSYIWLLALIPFLMEKEDKEVQWHAKHGLVLLGAEFIVWIALVIATMVGNMVVDLSCLGCIWQPILWLVFLVVHVLCIVKALDGKRFLIPGVSEFADKF